MDTCLDRCAKAAYDTFVEASREFAPGMAGLQPRWADMPEPMKELWRKLAAAAIRESAKGNA